MTDINPNPTPSVGDDDQVLDPQNPQGEGDQGQGDGKRTAEARIQEILAKNKQLEAELQGIKEKMVPPPPPVVPDPTVDNPEVQKAAEFLKQMGFVHKDELKQREQVMNDRMVLNSEHQRLESSYNGNDGRPKYNRSDVETYMRNNGIFGSPEAAYKLMNEAELLDWTLKSLKQPKQRASAIRPGGSAVSPDDQTITRERLQQVVDNPTDPENRAWYEQNRMKILDLGAKRQL